MKERKVVAITNWQAVTLVILRLAIGWHFLREGQVKFSKPDWTSAGYLRNSTGPLAPGFKALADNDGAQPFTQRDLLNLGKLVQKLKDPKDPVSEYLAEQLSTESTVLLIDAKPGKVSADLKKSLLTDLNKALKDEFLYDEDRFAAVELPEETKRDALRPLADRDLARCNRRLLVAAYPGVLAPATNYLRWADLATKWGVTLVGLGLITGTFTRLSVLGAMFFLVLFYLALPPWPETMLGLDMMRQVQHPLWTGLAQPGREGNYLFIDKNVIEFLALLVLLAFNTGRFMGLDALLNSRRRAKKPPATD